MYNKKIGKGKGGVSFMAVETTKKDLNCTVNVNLPSKDVKEVIVKDVIIDGTRASIRLSLKMV